MGHIYEKSNLFIEVRSTNEYGSVFASRTVVTHARCIGERDGCAIFRVLGERVRSSRCSSGGFDHQVGWADVVREFGRILPDPARTQEIWAGGYRDARQRTYLFLPLEEGMDGSRVHSAGGSDYFRWWPEPFGRLRKPE